MSVEKEFKEFKYVEFIRNPRSNVNNGNQNKLKWMAFDYFDFIYISKNMDQLIDCMDYQNDIPCEAYQSIGIFRDGNQDPVNTDFPFMAVLQVTIMKEAYQCEEMNSTGERAFYEREKDDLAKIVKDTSHFAQNVKKDFGVYYTVNNIDFCILLYTDRLDLAEYIANQIKAVLTTKENIPKYSVYSTVGISSDFERQDELTYMDVDTTLVARVLLGREFYTEKITKDFCENLGNGNAACVTNTHSLPGKYGLSIRVDGAEKILGVLPLIVKYKFGTMDNAEDLKVVTTDESENAIAFLLSRGCVRSLNTRIFCNGQNSFKNIKNDSVKIKELENWEKNQLSRCMDLKEAVKKLEERFDSGQKDSDIYYFKRVIKGYLEKLKRIIHTCGALSFNDDTKVNMVMLRKYLEAFLDLMEFNAGFLESNLIAQKDYAVNALNGINYIEQYIKIVTSVNGNSFETPQFGTERDECSIGKLPIAYTEYLCAVFNSYFEKRTNKNTRTEDDEIEYFPQYFPLIVPYMIDGDSDCMMSTLFSQNMSDHWAQIKKKWVKYIAEGHKVLMFIICQDMTKYKDVSSLLASSFHELGHYSNRITRKERNSDLLKIFSEKIAGMIVRSWIGSTEIGCCTMWTMEIEADLVFYLIKSVQEALIEYMEGQMDQYMDYPESVFNEKFFWEVEQLCSPYFNCFNNEILKDGLQDKIYDVLNSEFADISDEGMTDIQIFDELREKACVALEKLGEKLDKLISGRDGESDDSKLNLRIEDLESSIVREKVTEIKTFVDDFLSVLRTISWDYIQEETAETVLASVKQVVRGVDISTFIRNEFQNYDEESQRQIESFRYVKGVLEYAHEVLVLCLRYGGKSYVDRALCSEIAKKICVADSEPIDSVKESVAKSILRKHQFIQNAFEKYSHYVQDEFENIKMSTKQFYEFYAKMHITPDSGFLSEFQKALNQSVMGLDIRDSTLDLEKSCYEESLADISMCANLSLEAHEYLAVVMNYFENNYEEDATWKIRRIVIVLSYLWFIRNEEKKEWEAEKLDEMIGLFGERMNELISELKGITLVKPVESILKMIVEKYPIVMDSYLFQVTMQRVEKLKPYFQFLGKDEKDDVEFIHEALREKLEQGAKKSPEVQNMEIEFFLKYYYKNRKKYSSE